jgi:large subunit ribosomal protein L25
MTPIALSVERRDLRVALSGPAGVNAILELSVDGSTYPAIVKELQRHPVRRTVSHIDFQQINMNEEITVAVPVRLTGNAKAVLAEGGLVDAAVDTIDIRCTAMTLPNEIVIDVTEMQPYDVIRLSEVALPAGVSAVGDPDTAVVTTLFQSKEEAAAPAAEADAAAPAAPAAE